MQRVTRKTPCPVCGKPDWCLVAEDGSAAICQRNKEDSVKSCGDAGYLHILAGRYKRKKRSSQQIFTVEQDGRPDKDFAALQQRYSRQITDEQLNNLSQRLGVSIQSLKRLNVGWDGKAYTFPMCNAQGRIIGIRRRFPNGIKVSVKGSKTGLFIPSRRTISELVLICEGTTDTTAAIDLGFDSIGRPNCNSLIKMTASAVKDYQKIVIVGDNDTAGKIGAEKLASYLAIRCPKVKVIYPPEGIKDLRQWLIKGLTTAHLKQIIDKTDTAKVQIRVKD